MATLWRALDVGPAEREDSFVEAVSDSIAPYGDPSDMVVDDGDEIHAVSAGPLRVMRIRWGHGEARRSPRQIRRSDPELCKIDVNLSGRFASEQSDRQANLGAGTFTFVDLSRPHRVSSRRVELAVVIFPRALLPLRDKDINELSGTAFDTTHTGGALVTAVVREMAADLESFARNGGDRIAGSILDLISATLAARVDRARALPSESQQRVLIQRIRAFIEANLADRELSPRVIAARHHISPRLLHKLFEQEETTVADLIRSRRLARCCRDLLDPAKATTPVSAIAVRWGLRDAAYFNRVFHQTFGLPPGEYRSRALRGQLETGRRQASAATRPLSPDAQQ
jgi:AraC-like DNA-binding protein